MSNKSFVETLQRTAEKNCGLEFENIYRFELFLLNCLQISAIDKRHNMIAI